MKPINPVEKRRIVAGVVLLREDHAALLQLRDDKPGLRTAGKWVFPGGHCEDGEAIQECARRELREETDYDCPEMKHLITLDDDSEPDFAPQHVTFFWARFDGCQTVQCREGQSLEFVRRDRAAAIPIPPYLIQVWDRAITEFSHQFAKDATHS